MGILAATVDLMWIAALDEDRQRFRTVTVVPPDLDAFKTPGLRNVARTVRYRRDGSVAARGDAVDLDVCRCGAR